MREMIAAVIVRRLAPDVWRALDEVFFLARFEREEIGSPSAQRAVQLVNDWRRKSRPWRRLLRKLKIVA
jgi:hypothetical protein